MLLNILLILCCLLLAVNAVFITQVIVLVSRRNAEYQDCYTRLTALEQFVARMSDTEDVTGLLAERTEPMPEHPPGEAGLPATEVFDPKDKSRAYIPPKKETEFPKFTDTNA